MMTLKIVDGACSKDTIGYPGHLAVSHAAPGLTAHHQLPWHLVSGEAARTTDPGSERQVCRERQSRTETPWRPCPPPQIEKLRLRDSHPLPS